MAQDLNTPIVETTTATTIQITGFVNNIEEERCEIHYMILLEDGAPYKRGNLVVSGHDEAKALYAEYDTVMAEGKNFETASTEILYRRVLESI